MVRIISSNETSSTDLNNSSNVSIVQATVNRISGYSEQYNAAIKTTFTAAEKGSIFCDTLVKEPTTQHALAETITKLITVADKGYGRSVQAHGQLLSIHAGLVQVTYLIYRKML